MIKTPYIEITLSTGKTVKVYPVNRALLGLALNSIDKPPIPKRKVNPEAAIPGMTDDQELEDPENPEYKEKLAEYNLKRFEKFVDVRLIYGLRDEEPPANWPTAKDQKVWEFLGLKVIVPEDEYGKKLAWLKYDLLSAGADMDMVIATISAYDDLPPEEINKLIDSFRHNS